ncbi:MAG: recO [Gammaproteobacteria bacterium]|jgi:DNA repair protein RecO (recombination protein O)|nr:recO [Gammaproteobacteria bacterium]
MRQKHDHLNAYVLHARPFRETSLLIDFFTQELGRISAIAKGAYRGKSSTRLLLQPFRLLAVSLQGTTELLTLTQVESLSLAPYFEGQALVCGLYLNELLYHTLHREDPHSRLFQAYQYALNALPHHQALALREFELTLLEELGYGIHFEKITEPTEYYQYDPQRGFQMLKHESQTGFYGETLLQISQGDLKDAAVLNAAKKLTRLALAPVLNGKEIRSRELLF